MDPHVRGLLGSNLILPLTCQQTGEKGRKCSDICPLNKGASCEVPEGSHLFLNWKFPAQQILLNFLPST